ncbi:hypothetical protein WN51_06583 [Melipona quadrifasciata]|uniref:Uncharacterized protein n=1 Tax=Melipona quadrifasciata TaxID=166423 RepID=A0A0N0U3E8_9HYME|nr:hypothetical protein WN51_06583 [Melipona quadrifasciata]
MRDTQLTSTSSASPETPPLIRLPTIALPQFHGTLGEWVYFRDSFESLINRNESLSNIDRFHYLKSAVKGKTLPVSNSNYDATQALRGHQ